MFLPEILESNFSDSQLTKRNNYIYEFCKNTLDLKKRETDIFILLISGPSGSGKDSIVNLLPKEFQRIKTCTTRRRRPSEYKNDPYIRLTINEFKKGIKKDEFLETNFYDGNYYGSKISEIKKIADKKVIPVLRIDPTGAKNVLTRMKENSNVLDKIRVLYFYITPPSKQLLRRRIFKRDVDFIKDEKKKEKATKKALDRIENTLEKDLSLMKYSHFVVINYENRLREVTKNIILTFKNYLR